MNENAWLKLYYKMLDWRWLKYPKTFQIFVILLLLANIDDYGFENTVIHRGQLATSYDSLSRISGQSVQSVRTALDHLKSTGEITTESNSRFTVITITKYDQYQSRKKIQRRKSTGQQQAINNNKRDKNIDFPPTAEKEKRKTACRAVTDKDGNYIPREWEYRIPKEYWGKFGTYEDWLDRPEENGDDAAS
ncbi:MAG: hypothetical protein IJQ02_11680 [Oscillospiraceae bacterium]|nr:hypothetical protein [Oscillospiraceae bacterium]